MSTEVVLLGAGLVAGPVVRYLGQHGVRITIAANNPQRAGELLAGQDGQVVDWKATDLVALDGLLASGASGGRGPLVISLLPASFHARIAQRCIAHGSSLVTASYTSKEMWALDEAAKKAGVILLNEIGLDPGIDHMSAMQLLDRIRDQGGRALSFRSYCGGLPAPEAADNPLRYKFSWSPEGVLRATLASARYRENGVEKRLSPDEVTAAHHALVVGEMGTLEAYPNRDALEYLELYRLTGVETLYRGTLRYPGWCETIGVLRELGLLSVEPSVVGHWRTLLARALGCEPAGVRATLDARFPSRVGELLEFIGLLSPHAPIEGEHVLGALAAAMARKMALGPGERDLVVMHHEIIEALPDGRQVRHLASLSAFGEPDGDSAMAKTVGWPVAIAARLILERTPLPPGVLLPVEREIYAPVLAELATLGVALVERSEPQMEV